MIDHEGHIIFYGQTQSGKTSYTKHLIENIYKPEKLYVFTTIPRTWKDFYNARVFSKEDFQENVHKIILECDKIIGKELDPKARFLVVFDDFNDAINTQTDSSYRQLWTASRHSGIRIINMAQQTKMIGKIPRANARFILMMAMISNDEIKELASIYCNNNYIKLLEICRNSQKINSRAVILFDKDLNEFAYDYNYADNKQIVDADGNPLITSLVVTLSHPDNTSLLPIDRMTYHGLPDLSPQILPAQPQNTFNINNKQATNMYDKSTNNIAINNSLKNSQIIETTNTHHELKMLTITNNYKLQLKQDMYDIRTSLVHKSSQSYEDMEKIIKTANHVLRPSIPYELEDYDEAMDDLMREFFPDDKYRKTKINTDITEPSNLFNIALKGCHLYMNRNNPQNLICEGYNLVKHFKETLNN